MRASISAALAAALLLGAGAVGATDLKLSHQWATGDVRHQVAQMVADDVAAANVDLKIEIFPSGALFKANEQYRPLTRGQLDMTVLPLSYAGGQQPAYNLTLMPGLVKSHDHAARLSASPFMAEIEKILAEDDVVVLVHGYLAGGIGVKGECVTAPEQMDGKQTRAAGKSFEQMLAKAGASISSMPSSELYNGLQTGVLNAAITSSESFVSFRLYEQLDCYTAPGDVALWFMYQPLLMNKTAYEALTAPQQAALRAASAKAQTFYLDAAKNADVAAVEAFRKAGVKLASMTPADFDAWRKVAAESSYPEFVKSTPDGQRLLDLALAVE